MDPLLHLLETGVPQDVHYLIYPKAILSKRVGGL